MLVKGALSGSQRCAQPSLPSGVMQKKVKKAMKTKVMKVMKATKAMKVMKTKAMKAMKVKKTTIQQKLKLVTSKQHSTMTSKTAISMA